MQRIATQGVACVFALFFVFCPYLLISAPSLLFYLSHKFSYSYPSHFTLKISSKFEQSLNFQFKWHRFCIWFNIIRIVHELSWCTCSGGFVWCPGVAPTIPIFSIRSGKKIDFFLPIFPIPATPNKTTSVTPNIYSCVLPCTHVCLEFILIACEC